MILLFNRRAQTVILTRQFRFPVFVNGHDGMLIEAAAGLLDNASPEAHPRRSGRGNRLFRAERGEGVRSLHEPRLGHREAALFRRRVSGGRPRQRGWRGGGGGEDLEVLELPLAQALQAVRQGTIVDAKTIMLLQFVALNRTLEEER